MSTNKWAAFADDELDLIEDWALGYEGVGPAHRRMLAEVEAEWERRGRLKPQPTGLGYVVETVPGMAANNVIEAFGASVAKLRKGEA